MGRCAMYVGTGNQPIMYNMIRNLLTEKKNYINNIVIQKMYTNTLLSSKCTEIHCYSENVEKRHPCPENVDKKVSEKVQKYTVHKLYTKHISSGSVHKHSVVEKVHTNTLYYHMVQSRDCKKNVIESNNLHNTINSSVT
jgi:hypothetical protein